MIFYIASVSHALLWVSAIGCIVAAGVGVIALAHMANGVEWTRPVLIGALIALGICVSGVVLIPSESTFLHAAGYECTDLRLSGRCWGEWVKR